MEKTKSQARILDIVYIAMFAALIAVCSWTTIPTIVPFTLQTFGVFLTLGMLGGKRGAAAVVVYVLLGLVGAPVFANFQGGFAVLAGTTGGYIIGFVVSALLYWLITKLLGNKLPVVIIASVLGLIVCYAFGTAWFMIVYSASKGGVELLTALGWCVFPFILPDLAKIALAVTTAKLLKRYTPLKF